jgi:hypothetical protein
MAINTLFVEDEMVGRAIGTGKAAQKNLAWEFACPRTQFVPACHPWAWIASATK